MTLQLNVATFAPVIVLLAAAAVLTALAAFAATPAGARRGWGEALVARSGVLAAAGLIGAAAGVLPILLNEEPERRGALCSAPEVSDGLCLYAVGPVEASLQLLILVVALLALALGSDREPQPLRIALLLFAVAGAITAPAAGDVVSLVLAINLAVLPVVLLLATDRGTTVPVSALVTAGVAAVLSVVGAALWVGAARTPWLADAFGPDIVDEAPVVLTAAAALIAVGSAPALGLAPFHGWSERAVPPGSTSAARLVLLIPAIGAAGGLLTLTSAFAGRDADPLVPIIVLAVASVFWAGVAALRQQDLHALIGSSTAIQLGWVLLPLAAVTGASAGAAAGYLVVAIAATILVAAVVLGTAKAGAATSVAAQRGLLRRRPLTGLALGFALLTLAGLPPAVAGSVAKIVAIGPLMESGTWWLIVPAAAAYALTVAVYLRWLLVICGPADATTDDTTETQQGTASADQGTGPVLPWPHRTVVAVAVVVLILGSIVPTWVW